MNKNSKILVTGGSGMIGVALQSVAPDAVFLSSKDCDLLDQKQTEEIFDHYKPDSVIHLAARVGGVKANYDNLGLFFADNMRININVLDAARKSNVGKLVSLMSTCVYPDAAHYPLTEDQINKGEPHYTNFAYAYAKRMLDVQSRAYRKQYGCNFITAIPNNLFGENDNFHLEDSHVLPAIIRKMYEAKINNKDVVLWGDGSPLREFTYSIDLARILLFLLDNYSEPEPINIGNTEECSVKEVAKMIAEIIGFDGKIVWDSSKPSGQFKKPSDNTKLMNLGWKESDYTNLHDALVKTCSWFTENYPNVRGAN